MNINQAINNVIERYLASYPFFDMCIAKVVSVDPISIQIGNTEPIPSQAIKLTNGVIEKTIDIVEHKHSYYDSDTGEGSSGSATRDTDIKLQNVQVYENKIPLGRSKDNKIIINKKLEVNDLVLVLKAKKGSYFIILSRIYENK